jgi:hypothetical protein
MELHSAHRQLISATSILRTGTLIGLAGGFAEIAFIWAYMTLSGRHAASIAQGVAAAVHLDATSVLAGLAVHMGLAILLGLALTGAWNALRGSQSTGAAAYGFMSAMLVGVWAFNFFVLLPQLGPAFLALLPYPISFASKLAFALAGAPMLQRLGSRSGRRGFGPRRTADSMRFGA